MRSLLILLAAALFWASQASASMVFVPSCTHANRAQCGVSSGITTIYRITDSNAAGSCTAGGGANEVLCLCEGTTCVGIADDAGDGAIGATLTFGSNSESVNNSTDATFDFTRNDAGAVTILCSDDDATCAMTYDAGGAAAITIGSADVTSVTVNSDTGLTFSNNSDSVNNLTDSTFDFTRDDAGVVTITASDDDTTAALTVDPGGAAALTLGSADVTNITLSSDSDVSLQGGATGNVDLTFRDYADSTDDDMEHAIIRSNCTDAGTGAEDCDIEFLQAVGGSAPARALLLDADGNAVATTQPWTIRIQNGASPGATCTVGELFVDTDETDDTNCTTTADNSLCLCTAADTWTALENN